MFKIGFYLALLPLLSQCGQVCVGPFGATDVCYAPLSGGAAGTTTNCGTGTGLCITVTPVNLISGQVARGLSLSMAAQNGAAPYTWSQILVAGRPGTLGGETAGVNVGTFTGGTATYQAPADGAGTTRIVLTDSTTRQTFYVFDTP